MKIIYSENAPAAIGPYSQAIKTGNLLFISGQIGFIPSTGKLAGNSVDEQAEQICANIKTVLKEAGLSMSDVVKTTCFLTDMGEFKKFNAVYAKHFISKPARSCIGVTALPGGAVCEIEVIAEFK